MATSLQFSSEHHPIPQENHQTMNQTATGGGRRRSSKNNQKKKKQPQRGMGVEQLERLRVQDQIKNSTIHGVHHNQYYSNNNFPNFTPLSSFTGCGSARASASASAGGDPGIYSNSILNSSPVLQFPKLCAVSPNDFFMQQKVVNTGFVGSSSTNQLMISSHDHHQFQSQMNLYGFATSKPSNEKSKELYSMPNLFSSNNSCFSDRCRSCNKKRMINGEEISIHMEDMIREKENSGTKPLLHSYTLPNRLEKGVEIVAIHRKGSSSALSSSEEGAVMMEYDFFPEKISSSTNNYTSCFEKEASMMSADNSPESSSFAAAAVGNIINGEASSVTTISWAADTTTTPTSSIDLSLKLSC